MAEEIGSKPIDVQTLENIDSFDDLPDVTELTEEQLYAIRSGDLSSDYIAPFEWDGASYEQWRSIIDGRYITIPNEVVVQHTATGFSVGDSIIPNDAGQNNDLSLSGDPQETTLSDSSDAVAFGVDDHGLFSLPPSIENDGLNQFTIELALEYTSSDDNWIAGVATGDQQINIRANTNENFNDDEGNFYFSLRDDSDNRLRCAPSSNPNLNDGNRHDITIIVNDAGNNDIDIIIDGSNVTLNFGDNDSPSNFIDWEHNMALSADNRQGSIERNIEIDWGAWRFWEDNQESQTIDGYPF